MTTFVVLPYRYVDFADMQALKATAAAYGKALATVKDKEATAEEKKAARAIILDSERTLARLAA